LKRAFSAIPPLISRGEFGNALIDFLNEASIASLTMEPRLKRFSVVAAPSFWEVAFRFQKLEKGSLIVSDHAPILANFPNLAVRAFVILVHPLSVLLGLRLALGNPLGCVWFYFIDFGVFPIQPVDAGLAIRWIAGVVNREFFFHMWPFRHVVDESLRAESEIPHHTVHLLVKIVGELPCFGFLLGCFAAGCFYFANSNLFEDIVQGAAILKAGDFVVLFGEVGKPFLALLRNLG
jgi:hypothetical protein